MNTENYNLHTLFLISAIILGNASIAMPFLLYKNSVLNIILCFGITVISALILLSFINKLKGAVFYLFASLIILISFYGAASAFADYICFLKSLGSSRALSALALVVLVVLLTVCQSGAFLKFGLLMGFITAVLTVLLFLVSIGNYDFKNIGLISLNFKTKDILLCFLKYFSPVLSAVCFASFSKHRLKVKSTFFGVLLGFALLVFCFLQSLLMFGKSAVCYDYPYLAAVSAYSSGQLYIRQDGFVWFIFFAASVLKISLCAKTIWLLLKHKKTAIG